MFLLLLSLPTYLIRFKILGIPTTLLETLIYLTTLLWLIQRLSKKDLKLRLKHILQRIGPFLPPLLLFFFSALLATLISPNKILSLGVLKGWYFDPLLVLILLLDSLHLKKHTWLQKKILLPLLFSALLISLYGLIEYLFGFGLDTDGRLNSVYRPANFVALYIVPILFLSIPLGKKLSLSSPKTILLIFSTAILLLTLFFTHSYGGWLGLGAGMFYLFCSIKNTRIKKQLLLAGIILSLTLLLFEIHNPKLQRLFMFEQRSAVSTRLEIWQTSLLIISRHPFLGIGLGNFEATYRQTVPEIKFPPLEWLVNKAHNLYLNLWIEMGGLGLLAFLWLIYLFFKKTTLPCLLNLSLNAAMLSLLTHGLVDTPLFKNDLAVLFWVIIGLKIMKSLPSSNSSQ